MRRLVPRARARAVERVPALTSFGEPIKLVFIFFHCVVFNLSRVGQEGGTRPDGS